MVCLEENEGAVDGCALGGVAGEGVGVVDVRSGRGFRAGSTRPNAEGNPDAPFAASPDRRGGSARCS